MTPERFQRIKQVYWAVAARPESERAAALSQLCGDDEALRQEVEALLGQHGASAFFNTPAIARAAPDLPSQPGSWIGRRLGPYAITSVLGAGGMGEVYRARDSQLGRDVAIKVLPAVWLADPERRARFDREARVLAALNHPNIATIYGVVDIADSDSMRAIVLELVEGGTLADRLTDGPLPIDEALDVAAQIAGALEAAHERGIIHRDLKPSNITVAADGTVKVLDFGLAKVDTSQLSGTALSQSPTMTASMAGMLLGTAAYMSPEQVNGQETDRRSDVWAFGCVLYEMLAGRAAFEGETVSEILASVLKSEPDWNRLPRATPPGVRRALRRCLQKNRRERLHDIGDVRLELDDARAEAHSGDRTQNASRRRERLAWGVALSLVAVTVAGLARLAMRPAAAPPELRLDIATPPSTDPLSLAISPDGRSVVFAAGDERSSQLWLRPLGQASARPLPGTDGGTQPFWAPDGRSLAFFADGKLKRIDIDSGSTRVLADIRNPRGGTWGRDDTILLPPDLGLPISRLPATGGEPVPVVPFRAPEHLTHRLPHFLPDGRHFLYYVQGSARGIYVANLDGTTRRWFEAAAGAIPFTANRVLFVREGTLFAQRFDPATFELTGEPVVVIEEVLVGIGDTALFGRSAVSASITGTIAVRRNTGGDRAAQFVWFDRQGKVLGTVGSVDRADPRVPSSSPDGHRLVLDRNVSGNRDIWVLDLARGVFSRLTSHPANDSNPIWSPDGTRIVFASGRDRGLALYEKPADGSSEEKLLLATPANITPTDWSPDGRVILYRSLAPRQTLDIWALPLDGDRRPFPVAQTTFDERDAVFSPDGKWIAYQSDESGRFEIYLRPFPRPGPRLRVSTDGGIQAMWGRNGRELFYIAPDRRLMAAPIKLSGSSGDVGAPAALFTTRLGGDPTGSKHEYLVSRDGRRFLMNTVAADAATGPITVILNWKPKP